MPCLACDCSGGRVDPRMALAGADVAFRGTVLETEPVPWRDEWLFGLATELGWPWTPLPPSEEVVRLRVDAVWKGAPGPEVVVGSGPGSCAASFDVGSEYLVFASKRGGPLETSICDGTVGAGRRGGFHGVLRDLGPATPVPAASPDAEG